MKLWVGLKNKSAEKSIQFYVHELGMFTHDGRVWRSACSFRPIGSDAFELHVASWHSEPGKTPLFTLVVSNCEREFARLRKTHFASGGRIVPDKNGILDVFEYPAGANFLMEDPDGNRFVIHEDFTAGGEYE